MALLQGGFDTGFQMHDIIRQYCISRCSNPFMFLYQSPKLPKILKCFCIFPELRSSCPTLFNLAYHLPNFIPKETFSIV